MSQAMKRPEYSCEELLLWIRKIIEETAEIGACAVRVQDSVRHFSAHASARSAALREDAEVRQSRAEEMRLWCQQAEVRARNTVDANRRAFPNSAILRNLFYARASLENLRTATEAAKRRRDF